MLFINLKLLKLNSGMCFFTVNIYIIIYIIYIYMVKLRLSFIISESMFLINIKKC